MIVESLKEEKMYVKFSNNVEVEQRGSYLDVEGIKWQGFGSMLGKREKVIACTSRQLKVLMKDCMTNVLEGLNMRQSRWMKLFSEYGFEAKYHLGKANVVVESWSRKKSEAKNEFWIDVTVLWTVTGESKLNGLNLLHETTNKIAVIQERIEAAKLSKELPW
ncbi:hypothetical protein Tco_0017018 [Tanacetum coccineum]